MSFSRLLYPSDQLLFLLLFIGQVLRRQLQLVLDQLVFPAHCPYGSQTGGVKKKKKKAPILHHAHHVMSDIMVTSDSSPHSVGVEKIFLQLVSVVLLLFQDVVNRCGIPASRIQEDKHSVEGLC